MDKLYEKLVLQRQSAIPLYYQFKQFIIDKIEANELHERDLIPTEEELCKLYAISRPTLRQAFAELVNEGYLTRQRAKGTFVAKHSLSSKFVNKIMQFNEEMEALGVTHRTEVKKCAVENASPEIASALQLRDGKAIALQRLRFADGEPLVFEFTYIPYRLFRGIENLNFAKVSLYENMKKEYGLYVARTEKSVRAIAATAEIAEMLGTKEGAPILRIVTKGFSVENLPLEYSIAYYLSERYNMRLDVVSPDFKGCTNP